MKHVILRLTPLEAKVLFVAATRNDPDENSPDPIWEAAMTRAQKKLARARLLVDRGVLDNSYKL